MVDIVTHAGIGLVLGAPLLVSAPEAALGLIFGSVLPDLDAFSRMFGKRTFLACHQTWSHSLPVIALISLMASVFAALAGWSWLHLGLGLAVGMTLHSLLDLTNTYGITLWLPLKRQRLCLEWMFFIDLGTIVLTVGALLWIAQRLTLESGVGWLPTASWCGAMAGWIGLRGWLRRRALRLAPTGTVALIPSAWLPWRFYGTVEEDGSVRLITVDLRRQRLTDDVRVPVHDVQVQELLRTVPEVAIMRGLSPAYHVVTVTTTGAEQVIRCRDLRVRNFTSRFGACDITRIDGRTTRIDFHA
jgi:membrane-bound metal-dependent hydrolase YbcI (DUF457 family)